MSERREYLQEEGISGNKCNGYRPGRTYGHGRTLTFLISRDRYGNSVPSYWPYCEIRKLCMCKDGDTGKKGMSRIRSSEDAAQIFRKRLSTLNHVECWVWTGIAPRS